jgi:hypothetical protein
MLPGFRFLFAAIILCVSILVFGLGAAALLRAAHEEFASKPSWRGAPEATFTQHLETTSPVLAFVRLEPRPAVELKPAAAVAPAPVVAAPQVTAPAVVARIEPPAAVEPPAQAGETTAALRAPEASPSESQPGAPSPLPAGIQADAPKAAAPTETARSDVPPEVKADTRPQMPQDESPAPIAPLPAASTSDIAPARPAETTIATTEDAKPKAAEPKTTEPNPTEPKASDEAARVAAEPPPAVTASTNAPAATADAPVPSASISAPAANAPQTGDTAAKVATTGDPTVTLEPQSSAPAIGTRASMDPGRHAMQKQPRPQRTREQQQRRRLALRARVARQQPAVIAAQQQYAFPIQPQQQQPAQTFTPVQRPPSF